MHRLHASPFFVYPKTSKVRVGRFLAGLEFRVARTPTLFSFFQRAFFPSYAKEPVILDLASKRTSWLDHNLMMMPWYRIRRGSKIVERNEFECGKGFAVWAILNPPQTLRKSIYGSMTWRILKLGILLWIESTIAQTNMCIVSNPLRYSKYMFIVTEKKIVLSKWEDESSETNSVCLRI